jgi:exodeoxyribonuclease VII small subunit
MSEKTFEQAMQELDTLVKELEQGDIELSKAVEKYNQGMKLSKYCHDKLAQAEQVIVKQMKDGELSEFDQ